MGRESSWEGGIFLRLIFSVSSVSVNFPNHNFWLCWLTRSGQVGGSCGQGQATAPRREGVGGHDTELCSLPLLEGRRRVWHQTAMSAASTRVAGGKGEQKTWGERRRVIRRTSLVFYRLNCYMGRGLAVHTVGFLFPQIERERENDTKTEQDKWK